MDHYIAVHARAHSVLLLDCRTLTHRLIPLPERHSDRGVQFDGEAFDRRRASTTGAVPNAEAAVAKLHERNAERQQRCRDAELPQLEEAREGLGDLLFRRARHIVTENSRVIRAPLPHSRQTISRHSDHSWPTPIEACVTITRCSVRELDLLVDAATGRPGVFGARLTGGGFGGCTVNLVHAGSVEAFRCAISTSYESSTGIRPDILISEAADAGGPVDA